MVAMINCFLRTCLDAVRRFFFGFETAFTTHDLTGI
jgi:hypothetical protein